MTVCFVGSSYLIFEMTMKVKEDPIVTYISDVPVQVVDVSYARFYVKVTSKASHFRFLSLLSCIVRT